MRYFVEKIEQKDTLHTIFVAIDKADIDFDDCRILSIFPGHVFFDLQSGLGQTCSIYLLTNGYDEFYVAELLNH